MTKEHPRKVRRNSDSFATTIPMDIIKELEVKENDLFVWKLHNKKITVTHVPQSRTSGEQDSLEKAKDAIIKTGEGGSEKGTVVTLSKDYALDRLRIK